MAGHKIDNVFPADGTFAIPSTTSVVKGSRNPNAAKLLAEFTLSLEAQQLWPQSGVYAARSDVEPPAGNPPISDIKVLPMDYALHHERQRGGEEAVQRDLLDLMGRARRRQTGRPDQRGGVSIGVQFVRRCAMQLSALRASTRALTSQTPIPTMTRKNTSSTMFARRRSSSFS